MKKFLALLLALTMVFALAACGGNADPTPTPDTGTPTGDPVDPTGDPTTDPTDDPADITADDVPDTMTSSDNKYQLAFVTDVGQLKDQSFNEGTWNGVKLYGYQNDLSYKYYQPANGNEATDDDRYDAMKFAAESGAEVIVAAGFLQATALAQAAEEFPDVKFVFIDGFVLKAAADENGVAGEILTNISPIVFREEQCGYFAGYAAVKEGYTKLGFSGGGGGTNPACCRYGYGFAQGANAAAAEMDVQVELNYSWEYGSAYSASPELQTMANGWYENGTEVIFACGGSMFSSIASAASANDGFVIGVDSDQSGDSDTVITSAMKGVGEAAMFAIEKFYDGSWDSIGGIDTTLGVDEDAVGLPTATWSMVNYTVEQYNEAFEAVKAGTVTIDADYDNLEQEYSNLTLNIS